jgi:APA family basic amino acid/polyamine antiporter
MMIVAVLIIFAGISLISLSAMPPEELATVWGRDPIAGVAFYLPVETIRIILKPLIAVLAGTILLIATNAGLIGISRLAFSQGTHKLVPPALSRIHTRFKTPYISIIIFSLISVVILLPGFFSADIFADMGVLYAIGSLLAFMFSHAAIIALRIKKPEMQRPFKVGWNIHFKNRELPVTAIIGLLSCLGIWLLLLFTEPYSRWAGLGWMVGGLVIYLLFRLTRRKPRDEWEIKLDKK